VADLSVLIAARHEEWLARTIADVLEHSRADTEIIAVLDGQWAHPPIPDHPRVTLLYHPESLGQRAAVNEAARVSQARYVMKLDAHCAVDEGFDAKLIAADEELNRPDLTQIPAMYNLHAFNWKCQACGKETYQGPTPTGCLCGAVGPFERVVYWDRIANGLPGREVRTEYWRFDHELHFQYHGPKRPEQRRKELADVMSSIGACWFMRRERFWQLGGLDEAHGSWGQLGTEIACKSWLSGGRQIVNKRTWYAHLFRTQGKDFGFPYDNPESAKTKARQYSQDLWFNHRWPGQMRPLSWLVDYFAPIRGWHDPMGAEALARVHAPAQAPALKMRASKGLVYYSDSRLDVRIAAPVRQQLALCINGSPLVSVTLKPLDFGQNIVLPLIRGRLTMFRQILAGLEALDAHIAFLVEHDVLYHPSHFRFEPANQEIFYYNQNTWRVDVATGKALFYYCNQVSGLCAYRETLVDHYRKRIARVETNGYDHRIGYEPGNRRSREIDGRSASSWMSPGPNVDLRHSQNLTKSRWTRKEFRDHTTCLGWQESDSVPGWGTTADLLARLTTASAIAEV
jgi:hypothetical protein